MSWGKRGAALGFLEGGGILETPKDETAFLDKITYPGSQANGGDLVAGVQLEGFH